MERVVIYSGDDGTQTDVCRRRDKKRRPSGRQEQPRGGESR